LEPRRGQWDVSKPVDARERLLMGGPLISDLLAKYRASTASHPTVDSRRCERESLRNAARNTRDQLFRLNFALIGLPIGAVVSVLQRTSGPGKGSNLRGYRSSAPKCSKGVSASGTTFTSCASPHASPHHAQVAFLIIGLPEALCKLPRLNL
jgi:hypothetical protein